MEKHDRAQAVGHDPGLLIPNDPVLLDAKKRVKQAMRSTTAMFKAVMDETAKRLERAKREHWQDCPEKWDEYRQLVQRAEGFELMMKSYRWLLTDSLAS